MKKVTILMSFLLISLCSLANDNTPENQKRINDEDNKDNKVRISCTISAQDEWGTTVTYTASAGNIFMSAEDAGALACKRAYAMLLADLTAE